MPTFDFINIIRKIIQAAISTVCSPVGGVLAASALLMTLLSTFTDFFTSFSFPSFSINLNFDTTSDLLQLLFYCVNVDLLVQILSSFFSIVTTIITFSCEFVISLAGVLLVVGAYKVVRQNLKDFVS